ncbi:MAG: acyltransferase family protein [Clostridia bacterium]|nr:acyltransferase family protein [Clostridia bacterium]
MKERIKWIDTLRAFSILLIVFGHIIGYSDKMQGIYKYIYSFHVPIFFTISGFLFSLKPVERYKEFTIKKLKRIILPYFIFGLLFLIPYFMLGNTVTNEINQNSSTGFFKSIIGIIWGSGYDDLLKQNAPLWFLPCLFIMYQLFYFINKIKNKFTKENIRTELIVFLILCVTGCTLYINFKDIALPWGIMPAITLGMFFELGIILKILIKKLKKKKALSNILIPLLIVSGYIISLFNTTVLCMNCSLGNYLYFALSASATIIGIFLLFSKFGSQKSFEYIGKNTLGILIFHKLFVLVFQTKFGVISALLNTGPLIMQILLSFLILVITIILCNIIIKIINIFFPAMLGNKRTKMSG